MKTRGRMMVCSLAGMAILLLTWSGMAAAYTAATPELAAKVERVRAQMEQKVSNDELRAAAQSLKDLRKQINSYQTQLADPTKRTKGTAGVSAQGVMGIDFLPVPTGPVDANGNPSVPDYFTTPNWAFSPPLAKFVDTLPTLDCGNPNNLGQCLPVAVPDTVTYPGSDYYEISLREWHEQMHSDMPNGTPTRGYVQTNYGTDETLVPGGCTPGTAPSDNSCNTIAPPAAHYMGPVIIAKRNRPVRVKFTNELPTGAGGDLFIPVDQSVMGAGTGPLDSNGNVCDNTIEPNNCAFYTQNRATVHLHGGTTPWISDGTPHQWVVPAGEVTPFKHGPSYANVPDMPDPGEGSMTLYYSNQQSARLLFYHDHAFGITRLNVLAGMAAGYVITDDWEQDLVSRQIIPAEQIPLVIQDRTFVDATPVPNPFDNNKLTPTIRVTDPLWNWGTGPLDPQTGVRTPQTGDLWLPHVYMPAQNPYSPDGSGVAPYGRWLYGPWFYPPTVITHPPVTNPYADPDCNSDNPNILANCQTPGQPPVMPATPHPSMGMEAFFDSMIVNGTAFPRLEVEPKAYRFRILNAANDRGLNLSIYKADGTPANMSTADPANYAPGFDPKTEVKMVPAASTPGWPADWPTDGREGGVPDPGNLVNGRYENWGPSWVQIGTDAGFLPQPVVLDPQPITYRTDPTAFWVGNVYQTSLGLMPAERADVIVDFSQYAGQTLIVYNDAPTAWPALDFRYDYWTGAPDNRDSGGFGAGGSFNAVTGAWEGGHGPLPGFAPNTRTVMQIVVGNTVTPGKESVLDMAALEAEFTKNAPETPLNPADPVTGDTTPLFERAMAPIIVGQSGYDTAYNTSFPTAWPWLGIRSSLLERSLKFVTVAGEQVEIPMEPKGVHDEMGASFDPEYGRMSGNLAIELDPPTTNNANLNLYGFSDVPTEIVENSTTEQIQVTPLGTAADGTQIWNISHNGVDTHPIHFHIFDVQVVNRIGWDGQIEMPLPNEMGWKDTVRISPLEDTVVAVRPRAPVLPFGIPNSLRPFNPAIPIGSTMHFNNTDPATGQPYGPDSPYFGGVTNQLYDFGWEYVWHCHILSHEEMDMMRPIILQVETLAADDFVLNPTTDGSLTWADPTPVDYTLYPDYMTGDPGQFGNQTQNEIGFYVWRSVAGTGPWTKIGSTLANQTSFSDTGYVTGDTYSIEAYNAGYSTYSDAMGTVTLTTTGAPTAPATLPLQTAIAGPIASTQIDRIEYYDGTTLLGTVSGGAGSPYSFVWSGVQAGTYQLTALVVALAPDTGNPPVMSEIYAVSSPTPVTVGGGLTPDFTIDAQVPPVSVSHCSAATLAGSVVTGGTAPFTYDWTVNGVAYTGQFVAVPPLPASPTPYPVTLTVTDSLGVIGTVSHDLTVTNTPPTADAGGVGGTGGSGGTYTLAFGGSITLAGAGADADACDAASLAYAWDIDNDGTFDYTSNRTLTYDLLQPWLSAQGPGPYLMTFQVTDAAGSAVTATAWLDILPAPHALTDTTLASGTVNTAYSLQLNVVGGTGPFTWSAFGLPDGLTLDAATGIISGTPTAANIAPGCNVATFPVSIINVDSASSVVSKVLYLKIYN